MAINVSATTVLRTADSPSVNEDLLKRAAELTQQLDQYGLAPKSEYKLAPALGGTIVAKPPAHTVSLQSAAFGEVPEVTL